MYLTKKNLRFINIFTFSPSHARTFYIDNTTPHIYGNFAQSFSSILMPLPTLPLSSPQRKKRIIFFKNVTGYITYLLLDIVIGIYNIYQKVYIFFFHISLVAHTFLGSIFFFLNRIH